MSQSASFDQASWRVRVCETLAADPSVQAMASTELGWATLDHAGVVLEDDCGPLAVMAFFEDSAKTLSILDWICFRDMSFPMRSRAVQSLLDAVVAVSRSREFRCVRYLDYQKGRNGGCTAEQALRRAGFQRCVFASLWKPVGSLIDAHRERVGDEPDDEIVLVSVREWLNNATQKIRMEALIDRVSDCSEDVVALPKPNAAELLQCWGAKPSLAAVAYHEGQPVGLVVWSEVSVENGIEVMYEYLGIDPNHRRRKIATRLLLKSLDQIHRNHPHFPVDISVPVDQSNRPATRFYHALGFRQSTWSIHVWLHLTRDEDGPAAREYVGDEQMHVRIFDVS